MGIFTDIRPSPIAGLWYEGHPDSLRAAVDAYLDQAKIPALEGEVVGIIAPHAGHRYSGAVAGYAFAAVRGRSYPLVAVISPMHHPYFQPLLTSAHQAYATPLGTIPIDEVALAELDEALKRRLGYGLSAVRNDPEHSLEIELPFLQRALNAPFSLLPVMVRAVQPQVSQSLGEALAEVLQGRQALLIASTDLSHYYDQQTALALDRAMLEQFEKFSPEGAFEVEAQEKGYACGLGAVTAVLWAARARGANRVRVLYHATSGDITGDYSQVVGYAAAVILKVAEA
ncbi:MAG: AmmeMemoRadiSam system protein B [Anaerolineales bacterium]